MNTPDGSAAGFTPLGRSGMPPSVQAGFTVVELLVAMAVFFVVIGVVSAFLVSTVSTGGLLTRQVVALQDGRRALEAFAREFREATTSSIGSYAIESATPTSFVFYANVDGDSYRERVRYFLDGTNLKKGVTKPSGTPLAYRPETETVQVLVSSVVAGSALFAYYDGSYTGTQSALVPPVGPTQVRYVSFTLVIDEQPNVPPDPLTLKITASPRNLKTNL